MSSVSKPTVKELTNKMLHYRIVANSQRNDPEFAEKCLADTKRQIKYEADALLSKKQCQSNGDSAAYLTILEGLNKDGIVEKLRYNFGDAAFMEAVRCIMDYIIDDAEDEKSTRMKMHEYIGDLVRFGAESVNGYAIKANFAKTIGSVGKHPSEKFDGFVVMKCPRSPFKSSEMVHEVMVGLLGLNSVRQVCPNFSYLYDAFSNGPSLFDQKKHNIGWANQNKYKVCYALYENIEDAKEISKVQTANEMIQYYLQAILALKVANDICDFTHYDAHDENVLIREYKFHESGEVRPFYLKYPHKGKDIYLRSPGRIATFIDYGMSHARAEDGTMIGILDPTGFFNAYGTRTDESCVISDAYKLICFILMNYYDLKTPTSEQGQIADMCLRVLGCFFGVSKITDEDMVMIMDKQWNDRFHVRKELTGVNRGGKFTPYWTMEGLIDHCITLSKEISSDNVVEDFVPSDVFGVDAVPATRQNIIKELRQITTNVVEVPDSYEIYSSKGKASSAQIIEALNRSPELALQKSERQCEKLLSVDTNVSFYSVESMEHRDIVAHLALKVSNIKSVFVLIDTMIQINDKITELTYCVQLNDIFTGLLRKLSDKYTELTRLITRFVPSIKHGEKHLRKMIFNLPRKEDGVLKDQPDENDERAGKKDALFDLWDNYRNAVASLSEAGF